MDLDLLKSLRSMSEDDQAKVMGQLKQLIKWRDWIEHPTPHTLISEIAHAFQEQSGLEIESFT